jgi:hypothetical protein
MSKYINYCFSMSVADFHDWLYGPGIWSVTDYISCWLNEQPIRLRIDYTRW